MYEHKTAEVQYKSLPKATQSPKRCKYRMSTVEMKVKKFLEN